jgi:hypothetical protein
LACSADYIINTIVTLAAAPDANNTFIGWGGDCSGTGLLCEVTMGAAKNVTATFTPIRKLSVQKAGAGKGTITSSPPSGISPDINCGTACTTLVSADYIIGTLVTLTATPANAQNTFTGWSGVGVACPGTGTCEVAMDAAKDVTANFVIKGDINGDGTVNLADAILVLQLMSRGSPGGTIENVADTNSDGKLGVADAIYILQKVSGLR